MRLLYLSLGFITLSLGAVGVFLPVLPTTPFLLMTAYFFARGSSKFHHWFTSTQLYTHHLKDFVEARSMPQKKKWILLLSVSLLMLCTFIFIDILWVRVTILIMEIIKYWYFQTRVKSI